MMTLTIGRRLRTSVETFEEASSIYCKVRDESGEGGSTFPNGRITRGREKFYISYNGRVWKEDPSGRPRRPCNPDNLIFDSWNTAAPKGTWTKEGY